MDARTLHGHQKQLIRRFIALVAVACSVHIFQGLLVDANAAVFEPSTPAELVDAFAMAGTNAEDDVVNLRGQTFHLTDELVLEPDGGHGLELQNGILERTEDSEPFRLLNILPVPNSAQGDGLPVIIDGVEFINGLYRHDDQSSDVFSTGSDGGGALLTNRKTLIYDARFVNNRVEGSGSGGAIKHGKLLEISKALFADNRATANNQNDITHGGAIASDAGARLFVGHVYFSGNMADQGGAIYVSDKVIDLNITRSAFNGNQAQTNGGAIWSDVGEGGVRISNTSFIANHAPMGGAALYSQAEFSDVTLFHLTLWGNKSNPDMGAGIRLISAPRGSRFSLRNSVLGNNVGGNCSGVKIASLQINYSSFNLADDISCGRQGMEMLTDTATVFSGQLDYYGGSIPSMPIAISSPVHNLVPRSNCLSFDARDVPRLDNAFLPDQYCDAGAFEYVPQEYIDMDDDGVDNQQDNCVRVSNPLQSDIDEDGRGDQCDDRDDRDSDNDVVLNFRDNCPSMSNFLQLDANSNGIGDACELRTVHFKLAPVME